MLMAILIFIQVVFVAAKAFGLSAMSWGWVFSPILFWALFTSACWCLYLFLDWVESKL